MICNCGKGSNDCRSPTSSKGCSFARGLFSKFSESIRSDPSLVLEAVQSFGTAILPHLGHNPILNSAEFALRFAHAAKFVTPDALGYLSEHARSDPIVVLAFLWKNGLCLKDASHSLRGNEELVRIASRQNPMALVHCAPGGPAEQHVFGDREFMMDIFGRVRGCEYDLPAEKGDHSLYRRLSADLKIDHEIIFAAYDAGCWNHWDLPASVERDGAFWLKVDRYMDSLDSRL